MASSVVRENKVRSLQICDLEMPLDVIDNELDGKLPVSLFRVKDPARACVSIQNINEACQSHEISPTSESVPDMELLINLILNRRALQ